MKISKITTKYGVINNPKTITAKVVITYPDSAKYIIDKPVEKSINRMSKDLRMSILSCAKIFTQQNKPPKLNK